MWAKTKTIKLVTGAHNSENYHFLMPEVEIAYENLVLSRVNFAMWMLSLLLLFVIIQNRSCTL